MKVTLLDTKTGETREVAGRDYLFWTDGNGSCDCNRHQPFDLDDNDDFDDGSVEGTGGGMCVGGKRFLVIAAEFEEGDERHPISLAEMNYEYPDELLAEHGILQVASSPENITQFVPGQEAFPSAPVPDLAPDSVEYITLHPDFDAAMLGPSVHPTRPTVAVYSIEMLLAIIMSSELVGREMAQLNVRTMMEAVNADLGVRAPVFVDDYEFVKAKKKASDEEGPKIIV